MTNWRRLFSIIIIGTFGICLPFLYIFFQPSEWYQSLSVYKYLTSTSSMHRQDDVPQIKVSTRLNVSKEFIFTLNPVTKVYELDGKPVIWFYYDRENVPLYVWLLIEALQCRNPEFQTHMVYRSNIYDYLPDLGVAKNVFKHVLEPAHQADIFRVAIVRRFGGVYCDVDVYPLDKIYPVYQLLSEYDIVIGDWTKWFGPNGPNAPDVALAGLGPTRPNISLLDVWHQEQLRRIKSRYPHGAGAETIEDPFGWIYLLEQAEVDIPKEILSGRTKYLSFKAPPTENQLIDRGLAHGSMRSWSSEKHLFLPLNWAPFLFVWGGKMREAYGDINRVDGLIAPPGKETIYSAFVSCALLDCFENYTKLLESGATTSASGHINLKETIQVLKTVDRKICESIRNETKFDLRNFTSYDGLAQNRGNPESKSNDG